MARLLISNISRYIRLQEEEEAYFLSILQFRSYKKKETVLSAGELCRHEHFTLKGCLRTFHTDDKGDEHNIAFAPEDWWSSDMYSFITQTPATLSIEALEDSEVALISKTELEKLYEKVPKFERFYRILLQNAYVALQQRIRQNLADNAQLRYENFQKKYPGLEQRIPQKHIASYLGITPEFLSMMRRKAMEKE